LNSQKEKNRDLVFAKISFSCDNQEHYTDAGLLDRDYLEGFGLGKKRKEGQRESAENSGKNKRPTYQRAKKLAILLVDIFFLEIVNSRNAKPNALVFRNIRFAKSQG